ncbi:DNA replication/repair protein RecF [Williamsia sterculiae]|uniref:DNA replication and repair protein RecF n=1 Tax=Williamsia sterculiae TaxID=1344003 RepID=A0A1N7FG24_9NOCA|nr:DNA replication/repair protein RecF [Williamsia sterculiae]SIR99185.1 DNA replication and repair protein RecF [Williamsia sterculiae]
MYVRQLSLRDFRSWESVTLQLGPGATVFTGRNGFGKTNLLESLFYLANLRSHRVGSDQNLLRSGTSDAKISATVENSGRELTVEVVVTPGRANRAAINGAPARKARDVLGILRTVMFAPEDLLLIRGDPGERRRFLDDLAAMRGPRFVAARADYDRVLRQRSALLKTAAAAMRRGGQDAASVVSTLDVWDGQLAAHGAQVTAARLDTVAALAPHVIAAYASIAPHSRPVAMRYRASAGAEIDGDGSPAPGAADVEYIEAVLLTRLAELRAKEIERGVCLVGPHRDDLDLHLGADLAKGYASHGESWSLALALRLGSVELVRSDGVEPVLMLDDVFAELDARRRSHLVDFVAGAEQLLITAAVAEDIPDEIGGRRVEVSVEDVEPGGRRSVLR